MDDLDALLNSLSGTNVAPKPSATAPPAPVPRDVRPPPAAAKPTGGDDLDALLSSLSGASLQAPAPAAARPAPQPAAPVPAAKTSGGDDLDALLSSLGAAPAAAAAPLPRSAAPAPLPRSAAPAPTPATAKPAAADDLDALLSSLSGGVSQARPAPAPQSAPAAAPVRAAAPAGGDDLDALLSSLGAANTQSASVVQRAPAPTPVARTSPAAANSDLDALLSSLGAPKPAAAPAPGFSPAPQPSPAASNSDLEALLSSLGASAPAAASAPRSAPAPQPSPAAGNSDLDALLSSLGAPKAATPSPAAAAAAPPAKPQDLDSLLAGLGPATTSPHAPVGGAGAGATQPSAAPAGDLNSLLSGIQGGFGGAPVAGSKGTCAHCNGAILGEMIQAMGKFFHPEHWVCGQCNQHLGTRNFYEIGGRPQCEPCYTSSGCARCAYCQQPVSGRVLTALGKKWHPEHFNCAKCLNPFPDAKFFERDGKPWCNTCFHGSFGQTCGKCNETVSGDVINAMGKHWHPHHFVCAYCGCGFPDGQFFPKDGQPYCKTHYLTQSQANCAGCGQAISGRVVEAFGKKYHPEHFVCGFCMNPLGGAGYIEKDSKPYCKPCATRLF